MDKVLTLKSRSLTGISIDPNYSIIGSIMNTFTVIKSSNIRRIVKKDNDSTRAFINSVLLKRGGIGFEQHYYDSELSDLAGHYKSDSSNFLILTKKKSIVATIAMSRTMSDNGEVCELKKMFSSENIENMEALITRAQVWAIKKGLRTCVASIESRDKSLETALINSGFYVDSKEMSNVRLVCKL